MKKDILYFILLCAAVPLLFLGIFLFTRARTLGEDAARENEDCEEEFREDGPPTVQWDDKRYRWMASRVYEDLLCPDVAGVISEVVDGADPITENGQTNIPMLSEGDRIRRTAYGDAIAVFVEGRWIWLMLAKPLGEELEPDEIFYIPQNVWRPFVPDEGSERSAGVTLAAEQAVMDAETFAGAPHIALVLKNNSDHAISYRRGDLYVLKEVDGEWCFWFGQTEPGDVYWDIADVIPPSQEERFLAPLAEAIPETERAAGTYRVGMYVDCDAVTSGYDDGGRVFVYTELTIE